MVSAENARMISGDEGDMGSNGKNGPDDSAARRTPTVPALLNYYRALLGRVAAAGQERSPRDGADGRGPGVEESGSTNAVNGARERRVEELAPPALVARFAGLEELHRAELDEGDERGSS
jgi:hypothetical protein